MSSLSDARADVLVVGSGGAGMSAAVSAADAGASVIVTTKSALGAGNTGRAQGGIQAAMGDDDSPDSHYEDTFAAGHRAARPELVRQLADQGPDAIAWLSELGVAFTRDGGRLRLIRCGGATRRRLLQAGERTGAEMVRAATMHRFAERFVASGFSASALYPCYGLAEATVFVTGAELNGGARTAIDSLGREVVSCGRAASGERVVIVDPDTATEMPDGQVGEIWVSGDHVAQGYWSKPELSAHVFDRRIASGGGDRFLRTGDLGWMSEGELFFAGRLTDTIVFRGTNFYPEDIEATAAGCHSGLSNFGAAFPIDAGNEEQAVLVQELARPLPASFDPRAAVAAIATAIVNAHGLPLYDIVVVRAGTLPRTTSGKIRRKDCRAVYAAKGFAEASQESLRRLYHARDIRPAQRAT